VSRQAFDGVRGQVDAVVSCKLRIRNEEKRMVMQCEQCTRNDDTVEQVRPAGSVYHTLCPDCLRAWANEAINKTIMKCKENTDAKWRK